MVRSSRWWGRCPAPGAHGGAEPQGDRGRLRARSLPLLGTLSATSFASAAGTITPIPDQPNYNAGNVLGVSADGTTAVGIQLTDNGVGLAFYFKYGVFASPPKLATTEPGNVAYASNGDGAAFVGGDQFSNKDWSYKSSGGHTLLTDNEVVTTTNAKGSYSGGPVYRTGISDGTLFGPSGTTVNLGDATSTTGVSR